jgi:protein-S-isoprenylcysteine O-methyltransferase Ste14
VTPILGRFLFFLIAPCVLAGLVPWWITHWEFRVPFFGLEFARAIGMILIIAEWLGLVDPFALCFTGAGTPAPIAPTRKLVVKGLYRHVRNPIYVAVTTVILGQATLFGAWRLILYSALFWLACHVFVVAYEEPTLERTLGRNIRPSSRVGFRGLPRGDPRDSNKISNVARQDRLFSASIGPVASRS